MAHAIQVAEMAQVFIEFRRAPCRDVDARENHGENHSITGGRGLIIMKDTIRLMMGIDAGEIFPCLMSRMSMHRPAAQQ